MKRKNKVLAALFCAAVLINVVSWFCKPAVSWYRRYIFPLWTNTLARVMSGISLLSRGNTDLLWHFCYFICTGAACDSIGVSF